jgi:hypothetical protein
VAAWYADRDGPQEEAKVESRYTLGKNDTKDVTGHDARDGTHSYVSDVSDVSDAASVYRDATTPHTKTNDRTAPLPGPRPGLGANAPKPGPRPRKDDWATQINTYMVNPASGYYYHPGDTQARPKKEDVRVVLTPEEGMELFDREVLPSQKDRMAVMKELYHTKHAEKVEVAAVRVCHMVSNRLLDTEGEY